MRKPICISGVNLFSERETYISNCFLSIYAWKYHINIQMNMFQEKYVIPQSMFSCPHFKLMIFLVSSSWREAFATFHLFYPPELIEHKILDLYPKRPSNQSTLLLLSSSFPCQYLLLPDVLIYQPCFSISTLFSTPNSSTYSSLNHMQ